MILLFILQQDLGCKSSIEDFRQWELLNFFFEGRLGISCFEIFGSPNIMLVLPRSIPSCFSFLTLLVVVGHGNIHSVLEFIFFLAAVILTPQKYISFRVIIVRSGVFEAPFGKAVWFATGYYWGIFTSRFLGSLFLVSSCQIDDCWFGILSLRILKYYGFVVCV